MDKHHIEELSSAFDRALSELAAVAENEILPYEVRAAAMQAHISVSVRASETIVHLMSKIIPSGVVGVTLKGADLVATLGKQAKRASNADPAGPQHTETFKDAAMPAGATVTHKWDKS